MAGWNHWLHQFYKNTLTLFAMGNHLVQRNLVLWGGWGGGGGGMSVFHQNVDGLLEFNWFHAGLCGLVIATAPFTSIFGFYLSASPLWIIKHNWRKEERKMFNYTEHSTRFMLRLYGIGYIVLLGTQRKETYCCHYMGYSFQLAARVLLYAPSHRQDSTFHIRLLNQLWKNGWKRNSSMGPPWGIDPTTHRTMQIWFEPWYSEDRW